MFLVTFFGSSKTEYIVYLEGKRNEKKQLPKRIYEKVYYDVLMRYQFPMSTRDIPNLKNELSQQEFNLLCVDERKFLENKCKKINKNLRVKFIPTTLYEMLFAKLCIEQLLDWYAKKEEKPTSKNFSIARKEIPLSFRELFLNPPRTITCKSNEEFAKEHRNLINQKPKWGRLFIVKRVVLDEKKGEVSVYFTDTEGKNEETHIYNSKKCKEKKFLEIVKPAEPISFNTNNAILSYLNEHKDDIKLEKVIDNLFFLKSKTQKHFANMKKNYHFHAYFRFLNLLTRDVIAFRGLEGGEKGIAKAKKLLLEWFTSVINIEKEANAKGDFVISRGTPGCDNRIDKILEEYGHTGLSFGNSLMAGGIRDTSGKPATAFNFFLWKKRVIGYLLLINKKEYFDEDSFISRIAQISPWPTLVGLFSQGEGFHPRLLAKGLKESESEETFQRYLSKHARIIKNESKFSENELLPYRKKPIKRQPGRKFRRKKRAPLRPRIKSRKISLENFEKLTTKGLKKIYDAVFILVNNSLLEKSMEPMTKEESTDEIKNFEIKEALKSLAKSKTGVIDRSKSFRLQNISDEIIQAMLKRQRRREYFEKIRKTKK